MRNLKRGAAVLATLFLALGLSGVPAQAGNPKPSGEAKIDQIAKRLPDLGRSPGVSAKLTGPYYWYNTGEDDTQTNSTIPSGVAANFSVATPVVDTSVGDIHSLAQIAVRETIAGTDNIVEFGWAVNPGVFGDTNPHLFASKWENGSWCGSWTGSGSCGGAFVDVAGGVNLGDSLAAASGTGKAFKVIYFSNAWWVNYNGVDIGYFPKTGSGWPAAFDQTRIVQLFGEVLTDDNPPAGCTDMGSGVMGSSTTGASIGSVTYFNAAGASLPTTDVNLTVSESPASSGWNPTALSTRTFRYGGPGPNGC